VSLSPPKKRKMQPRHEGSGTLSSCARARDQVLSSLQRNQAETALKIVGEAARRIVVLIAAPTVPLMAPHSSCLYFPEPGSVFARCPMACRR
jgi:hypothetical protein